MTTTPPTTCLLDETNSKKTTYHSIPYRYIALNPEQPETIVFIPGTAGDEKIYCRVFNQLKTNYHILSFSHIHEKNLQNVITAIHDIIHQHNAHTPFHLVGTSLGGRIAQYYAQAYPQDIKTLTIANSYAENHTIKKQVKLMTTILKLIPTTIIKKQLHKNTMTNFQTLNPQDKQIINQYFKAFFNQTTRHELFKRIQWNLETLPLPQIEPRIPVLLIISDNDPLIPLQTRQHLMTYYKHATQKHFTNEGHFPYLVNPKEYARTLLEFINTSPSKP